MSRGYLFCRLRHMPNIRDASRYVGIDTGSLPTTVPIQRHRKNRQIDSQASRQESGLDPGRHPEQHGACALPAFCFSGPGECGAARSRQPPIRSTVPTGAAAAACDFGSPVGTGATTAGEPSDRLAPQRPLRRGQQRLKLERVLPRLSPPVLLRWVCGSGQADAGVRYGSIFGPQRQNGSVRVLPPADRGRHDVLHGLILVGIIYRRRVEAVDGPDAGAL